MSRMGVSGTGTAASRSRAARRASAEGAFGPAELRVGEFHQGRHLPDDAGETANVGPGDRLGDRVIAGEGVGIHLALPAVSGGAERTRGGEPREGAAGRGAFGQILDGHHDVTGEVLGEEPGERVGVFGEGGEQAAQEAVARVQRRQVETRILGRDAGAAGAASATGAGSGGAAAGRSHQ